MIGSPPGVAGRRPDEMLGQHKPRLSHELIATIRRANTPGPPEDSVQFRVAAWAAVAIGVCACAAEAEIGLGTAAGVIAALSFGMVFSYWTRHRPWRLLKPLIAAAAVAAFVYFFTSVSSIQGIEGLGAVEGPLALLFCFIQVTHSFDVPARRDLLFSLVGSATLMAVAAAQAVDDSFAIYVLIWLATCLWGLMVMWARMTGRARPSWSSALKASAGVLVIAVAVIAALPAPQATHSVVFPSSAASGLPVANPGGLAGRGSKGILPARAGKPGGKIQVGGYLGFAGPLDTALRGHLGNEVVMRVRASKPSFWIGETFDNWNGQSWTQTSKRIQTLSAGPPFNLPPPAFSPANPATDIQTFYVARQIPNLLFGAEQPVQIWFPESKIYLGPGNSLRSPISLGPGTIYSVVSEDTRATAAQLKADGTGQAGLSRTQISRYTQLPGPSGRYRRAHELAVSLTSSHRTTYGKVTAIENWMSSHLHYSTDIPPLEPGQDAVNQFLFGNRTGYCEQISTALAVMLRGLGIPAREAVGYVPGPYNPITDLYEVQAKDAHAWVQVWFPGYGWQSFDPTAVVPLANPSPGEVIGSLAARWIRRLPLGWMAAVLCLMIAGLLIGRKWSKRPRNWTEQVNRALERAGKKAAMKRLPTQTLGEYLTVLGLACPEAMPALEELGHALYQSAYAGREPGPKERKRLLGLALNLRLKQRGRVRRAAHRLTVHQQVAEMEQPGPRGSDRLDPVDSKSALAGEGSSPPEGQGPKASASSHDAPSASGRL